MIVTWGATTTKYNLYNLVNAIRSIIIHAAGIAMFMLRYVVFFFDELYYRNPQEMYTFPV